MRNNIKHSIKNNMKKNRSKKGGGLLVMCLVTLLLFGCSKKEEMSGTEKEETTLTIGMMSSLDVIPYVLINELELLKDSNVNLELEVFTSAKDRDAAFTAGQLDGVLTDFIGICMYQNGNFDVKITGITDGDYILVAGKNSEISSIEDIKGKSIAISENTLIDYTLDYILTENGMMSTDVVKEIVPRIPDRLELLRNEQIDLGLLPEPFASLALSSGAVSLGSANEFGLYPAVSAFSAKSIESKEEAIKKLYVAYNEAVNYMNETPISEYEKTVIESVGYPQEMIGTIVLPEFRTSSLPTRKEVDAAIAWAVNRNLCNPSLTYEQLVHNVY